MKKGFTLIELLIVIAIIAILAAILFVSIGQTPLAKSRDAKRTADMDSLRTALTLYYTDHTGTYPGPDIASLSAAGALVPTYISTMPVDPRPTALGCNQTYGGNTNMKYNYSAKKADGSACTTADGNCTNYVLQACLENVELTNQALQNDCDSITAVPACVADNVYDIHS